MLLVLPEFFVREESRASLELGPSPLAKEIWLAARLVCKKMVGDLWVPEWRKSRPRVSIALWKERVI